MKFMFSGEQQATDNRKFWEAYILASAIPF